ncbi:hypothetical protein UB46_19545 [Burkholderiaceae bacterium 16]|nr:hypothetical protein UB46_19545 [Burkholderiaceae bacterium 16]
MSEYQYYEFAAIDRPLTRAEMAQLRAVSTRARISPSGFVNHYEWGDLKADPADWMRRYFDVFVYTANWCCSRLALRVPLSTFGKAELMPFAIRHASTIEAYGEHWIIDWSLNEGEDYDRFGMQDGSGWMQRLAPLRAELMRGDLRPLYLGWLAGSHELSDDALEPEVPPGLATLSPPQEALVEFLEIDPDLLAAAAAASPDVSPGDAEQDDRIDAWLNEWPREEMAAVLKLLAQGLVHQAERQVRLRHAAWLKAQQVSTPSSTARRILGHLQELAEGASVARLQREAKAHAKQEAARRRKRETQLRLVMNDADKRWAAIDAQVQRGTASAYDEATKALAELADGYALTSSREAFERALRQLLASHAKRGALLRRLRDAGLCPA